MSLTKASDEAKEAFNSMVQKFNALLKAGEAMLNNKDDKKRMDLHDKWHEAWMEVPAAVKKAKDKLGTLEKALADYLKENKDQLEKDKSKMDTVNTAKYRIARIKEGTEAVEAALRASL